MKVNVVNFLIVFVLGIAAVSCSSKEQESRIAKLEGKIAELENKNGPAVTPGAVTPAAEPEVKPDGPLPSFAFNESSFDFGNVKEGDPAEHVFSFENTGNAPLIISSATATCGCTVPEWPREPIAVGGKGEIKVVYNSKGKSGMQNKVVTITANTYPKETRLTIKANVLKTDNPS